jgi:putative photosynthetic complex assembly protein
MSDTRIGDTSRLPSFPRGALIGAGTLIAFALAMAIVGRMNGPDTSLASVPQIAHRDLRFSDRADGGITVTNAETGAVVAVVAREHDNFLRATMRGLALQRERSGLGPETPFVLTRWADGRLTLTDPTNHRVLELEAFGETNEATFATLLTSSGPTQ